MGIFKKLFGKKEVKEDTKPLIDIDDMLMKTFFRYEAAYRHQKIVLPRFKSTNGIPLKSILEKLLPDVVSKINDMTELRTIQISAVETNSQHFINPEQALSCDLFWNMFYKNDDGELYPLTGTNITLTIRTNGENVPSYIVLFARGTSNGPDAAYIRISLMIPKDGEDDLRSSKSNSVPTMTSFLIACDTNDNPKIFEEYEEAEARVWNSLKAGKALRDEMDLELFHGIGEFQPYAEYIGYGKYLYENNRYYDAYTIFIRAINYLRTHPIDDMSDYYEVCKYTAICLMKHNHYEKAGYFYSMAYSGGAITIDEYEKFLVAIADIRSIDCLSADLINKHGSDIDKWPQEAQNKYNTIFFHYKKNCEDDKERSDKVSFYSDYAIGLILQRIANIEENTIDGMNVISPDGTVTTMTDREQIWNESIYNYLIPGTTIVFPYSRAHYATGDEEDKSILSHASSIIIRINSANNERNLVRVNIMIPNFNNNDDRLGTSATNDPISYSLIMSSKNEPLLAGEKDMNAIFDYALKCINQNRFFEAQIAYLYLYKKLAVNRLSLTDEEKEQFYRTAYCLGFCFEELQDHEVALFYLEMASCSGLDSHIQEYINALVNNRDPRALEFIRKVKNSGFDGDPESKSYQFHYAFLNRREAYVLIDLQKYDEAEALLKEMLNDPMSKEFAEGELKYIEQLRNQ